MKRTNDCWLFQKGWPEFVQQNSIKDHDVLVFCLVGNSTFSVTIFTPNGCTKGEEAAEDTSESGQFPHKLENTTNFSVFMSIH